MAAHLLLGAALEEENVEVSQPRGLAPFRKLWRSAFTSYVKPAMEDLWRQHESEH